MIFPVVGPVKYTNDYGAPRWQGSHQGNDLMAPRKAIAVAAEAGTVKFWTTSGAAGCMLYLYGKSGTTYYYIHLNNDLTDGNDNRGKCVAGTSYAHGLKSGARVAAGQPVGFVGDSGDANGTAPHLHFELHPKGGGATNPFPSLNTAARLLFASAPGKTFSLALSGTVVLAAKGVLEFKVDSLRSYPGGYRIVHGARTLSVNVPQHALIERKASGASGALSLVGLSSARKGMPVVAWTTPAPATLDAQLGRDGALSVERLILSPKP